MMKPVYLFSGFIDSGKTSALKETLYDGRFNEGEKTLIIALEEGDEEYDKKFLHFTNSEVLYLDKEDFTLEKMREIDKHYDFERVMIEMNGFSNEVELLKKGFIENWELAQTLVFFDASQFKTQAANLTQFMYNHVYFAEVCILNRYKGEDRRYIRNNLKAINPRLEIIFEDQDGNVDKEVVEDLFDLSKEIILNDYDYGLWYMDALDYPEKYDNKKMTMTLKWAEDLMDYDKALIMKREAMVCCADDIANLSITCVGIDKKKIDKEAYYEVSGVIHNLENEEGFLTCVLYVNDYKEVAAPLEPYISFN